MKTDRWPSSRHHSHPLRLQTSFVQCSLVSRPFSRLGLGKPVPMIHLPRWLQPRSHYVRRRTLTYGAVVIEHDDFYGSAHIHLSCVDARRRTQSRSVNWAFAVCRLWRLGCRRMISASRLSNPFLPHSNPRPLPRPLLAGLLPINYHFRWL